MNITTTELKQQINLLSKAKDEDIVLTKRSKPFAVVIDYNRYLELIDKLNSDTIAKNIDALNSLEPLNLGGKSYKEIKSEAK